MGWRSWLKRLVGSSPVEVGQLPVEGQLPEFVGVGPWINSEALTKESLAGQVVLVDFWTYSCINCLRTLPYLKAWHEAYARHGLVIVGVHTPEFPFEKDEANVRHEVARLGLPYPIVLDNDYRLWNSYRAHYWPSHYFIDSQGQVRSHHFGEGGYRHSEAVIRQLLKEAGATIDFDPVSDQVADDLAVAADPPAGQLTPETYLGFNRLEYLGSPESVALGVAKRYTAIDDPATNIFYLDGEWRIEEDFAVPAASGARLAFRAVSAEINLVMVGAEGGLRVKVLLDGQPLTAETAGTDCWAGGEFSLEVHEGRLYNLVRLSSPPAQHLLELVFLDPGAHLYAFTFG
jgi:thiol-disulfide isomerase/thioredoxin